MTLDLLKAVGELCQQLRDEAPMPDEERIPQYPKILVNYGGDIPGVCDATVGTCRLEDGTVERVISLFDSGDRIAPTLVLIEEQIDEFIRQTV